MAIVMVTCTLLECCTQTPPMSVIKFPWSAGALFTTPDGLIVDNTRWSVILVEYNHFYRATRMHRANYAVTRCLSVCLLVRLSMLTLNGYIYPQSFFSPPGSPTILVFPHQTEWQYSDGEPPNGDVECNGVWKNHDFRPISRFISELMQDRAIVTMEDE